MDDGDLVRSPEAPRRAAVIEEALQQAGHDFAEPETIERELLVSVHTADYVDFLSTAWDRWEERARAAPAAMGFAWPPRGLSTSRPRDLVGQLGFHSFSSDTAIVAGTWAAALSSASIAMTAADRALDDISTTYGLCRPPGHHATVDQFGGYCFLNNAAIAAQRLLDRGAGRVGVLDVDYHHGNGTQSIFYARSDVMVVSIHADPVDEFPWFAGHADEIGVGPGEGSNLNLPLPLGAGFDVWSEALEVGLARLDAARLDAQVVSLGVDIHEDDPLGTFRLSTDDLATIGARLRSPGRPTVILQEGGYAIDELGGNVAAFLEPLCN